MQIHDISHGKKILLVCLFTLLFVGQGHAAGEEAQAVNYEKNIISTTPQESSPGFELQIVGFGCVTGFGGWVEPAKDPKTEMACDQENLKFFATILDECLPQDSKNHTMSRIFMFDLDKDGCATCKDYLKWKEFMKELFKKEKRSTNGEELSFPRCENKNQ
jgi:hypothetical protein